VAVAEEEGPAGGDSVEAGAGTAMGASWFVTFPSIADPRSFASLSSDLDLFVTFTYPRIITLENLEALPLCSLWILMMPQRHSTI